MLDLEQFEIRGVLQLKLVAFELGVQLNRLVWLAFQAAAELDRPAFQKVFDTYHCIVELADAILPQTDSAVIREEARIARDDMRGLCDDVDRTEAIESVIGGIDFAPRMDLGETEELLIFNEINRLVGFRVLPFVETVNALVRQSAPTLVDALKLGREWDKGLHPDEIRMYPDFYWHTPAIGSWTRLRSEQYRAIKFGFRRLVAPHRATDADGYTLPLTGTSSWATQFQLLWRSVFQANLSLHAMPSGKKEDAFQKWWLGLRRRTTGALLGHIAHQWPPDGNWQIREGQFAVCGRTGSLSGEGWRLLKILVDNSKSSSSLLTQGKLLQLVFRTSAPTANDWDLLRQSIYRLNAALKFALGVDEELVVRSGRGLSATLGLLPPAQVRQLLNASRVESRNDTNNRQSCPARDCKSKGSHPVAP